MAARTAALAGLLTICTFQFSLEFKSAQIDPLLTMLVTLSAYGLLRRLRLSVLELQFGQGRNWPLGASLSVTLLIIVTAALLVYVKFANRDGGHG